MLSITVFCLIYGILIDQRIWNTYAKDACKDNNYTSDKNCEKMLTGVRGIMVVIVQTGFNMYFMYIHYLYCMQLTTVMLDVFDEWFGAVFRRKK